MKVNWIHRKQGKLPDKNINCENVTGLRSNTVHEEITEAWLNIQMEQNKS